jgi:hypothetical protein
MKRALVVLFALVAFLLVYPTSTPSAKSPGISDTPTIQINPRGPTPPAGGMGQSGEDDEGDADDLAGLKHGTRFDGGDPLGVGYFGSDGPLAKVWWMYFLSQIRVMF